MLSDQLKMCWNEFDVADHILHTYLNTLKTTVLIFFLILAKKLERKYQPATHYDI